MSKYAIAKIGGKQFKIQEGDTIKIERQEKLDFDVLLFSDGEKTEVGTPFLSDIKVKAKAEGEILGKKVRVVRFKAKSRYKKTKGHRQPISIVKIEEISKKAKKTSTKVTKEEDAEEAK
jgi:large subunit ribosomal protein L21